MQPIWSDEYGHHAAGAGSDELRAKHGQMIDLVRAADLLSTLKALHGDKGVVTSYTVIQVLKVKSVVGDMDAFQGRFQKAISNSKK